MISPKKRNLILITVTLIILIINGLYLYYEWHKYQEMASSEAAQLAESLESLLYIDHIEELSGNEADIGTPGYDLLKNSLISLVDTTNPIRFAYLMAERNGELVFLMDSESPWSPDYSPPGQIYDEVDEWVWAPFKTGDTVITPPRTDRWGTWVNALVPIKDPESGEIFAIFGIDYSASEWYAVLWEQMIPDISVVVVVLLLYFALLYIFLQHSRLNILNKKLTFNEALYRSVFEQAPIGIALMQDDTHASRTELIDTPINPTYAKILGRQEEDLRHMTWIEMTHSEDLAVDLDKFDQFKKGEIDGYTLEKRFIKSDGSVAWTNMRISHLLDVLGDNAIHLCLLEDISIRKQAEIELQRSEEQYRDIFKYSTDCIFLIDVEDEYKFKYNIFNPAEEKAIGLTTEQVSGKFVEELFNEELANELNIRYRSCCEQGVVVTYDEGISLPSRFIYFHTSLIPIKNSDGKVTQILGISSDITEVKLKEVALQERIKLEAAISEVSRLFISQEKADFDQILKIISETVSVNRIYIFKLKENGEKMDNLYEWCSHNTEPQIDLLQDLDSDLFPWWIKQLQDGNNIMFSDIDKLPPEAVNERSILQEQDIKSVFVVPIQSVGGTLEGYIGFDDTEKHREWSNEDVNILRVIAEVIGMYWIKQKAEDDLKYQATHDSLTNLPNRYLFEERLIELNSKAIKGVASSVLFIDLDNFKMINDTMGHKGGDELLIEIADVLKKNLRKDDFLSRLGGDEFSVLLEGASESEAVKKAEKLRQAIWSSTMDILPNEFSINSSISIGVAQLNASLDYTKILSLADMALYSAKDKGRNRVEVAKPDIESLNRLNETNHMLGVIKKALQENGFILHYQPIFNLSNGKILHYEALIRLMDLNGEMLFPGAFIPIAEDFGLMPQIDSWVINTVLADMRENPELSVFVNLSGVTLGDLATLDEIKTCILDSGINTAQLGIEITETSAVKNMIKAKKWINSIKDLGCSFALDDFGTGYSSFFHLSTLPEDYVKLDQTFIHDIDKNPVHLSIIKAIFTVATTLDKKVIAEFVENENIFNIINEIGIYAGQGFFLGKPHRLDNKSHVQDQSEE